MGIDFLYKNKNLLDISFKLKYKNYKTTLVLNKTRNNTIITFANKKSKCNVPMPLNIKKGDTSLKSLLYLSYYKSLYLHLYNWISNQPGLSISSEYGVKIINNGYKRVSSYKFYSLNHREYIVHYRLFEKLSIIN